MLVLFHILPMPNFCPFRSTMNGFRITANVKKHAPNDPKMTLAYPRLKVRNHIPSAYPDIFALL